MEKTKLYKSPKVEVFKIEAGNLLTGSDVSDCGGILSYGGGSSGGGRSRESSWDEEA